MKIVHIVLAGLFCGIISTARADIASVQYVESILQSLEIQADWDQTNTEALDYIKNKPTIPSTAADVGAVPTSRTVNTKALSDNITLDGSDIAVTGYTKPNSTAAIENTDTVNVAIGKLEKAIDGLVPDTRTVNGHALSSDVTVTSSDVGLGNVQNVDQTNASNLTSGTVDVARLPVGSTSTTVAAGNDGRFDSVSTTEPSASAPSGRVAVWFD